MNLICRIFEDFRYIMRKGFTLAEIMITLVVIGIISAIIMPIAINNVPDENVLKFKKANSTLYQAIQELVNSDKYYKDGDLGIRADGKQIFNDGGTGTKFFCTTFADVLSAKKVNCTTAAFECDADGAINCQTLGNSYVAKDVTKETLKTAKENYDKCCKKGALTRGKEIEAADGTVFFKLSNGAFGSQQYTNTDGTTTTLRYFSPPSQFPANYADTMGFDVVYMTICLDVDGFDETKGSESCDDVKDICPFGYGIRADGKILPGARAEEWLKKSIQGE